MTDWSMILRQQILTLLKQCGAYQLPEEGLRASLKQMMGEAVKDSEIDAALEWLKGKAFIDDTVEELSGERRWRITDAGKQKAR